MKAAELCAGYGGLALAVEQVFGAETAWVSEFEEAPSKILAHHWPHVPNYGDLTKIKWAPDCPSCGNMCAVYRDADNSPFYWCSACSQAWDISIRLSDPDASRIPEPADVASGGTPCQDLSHAGRRKGMTDGTRSNLWVHMREGIAIQRPKYVVWENVRGAYSAEAYSEMEQSEGRVGEGRDPYLRALGRVLGDLSDLGYDTQWRGLRAADVGAPHGRFRVFVLATYRGGKGLQIGGDRGVSRSQAVRGEEGSATLGDPALPTYPLGEHRGQRGIAAPGKAQVGRASAVDRGRSGAPAPSWGEYEPAIRRWEQALGRRAPVPTEPTGRNGGHRLSARFAEWMMGVPDGWIVDVPGITRNEALKAAGNGVVPQQAIAALRDMLAAQQGLDVAA